MSIKRELELTKDEPAEATDSDGYAPSAVMRSAPREGDRDTSDAFEPLQLHLARVRPQIIERFVRTMREEHVGREDATRTELMEHLPFFLADVEDALGRREIETTSVTAREHGSRRFRLGFDLRGVLREYAILRRCILGTIEEAGLVVSREDREILDSCLDEAMADAATAYARERASEVEAERQRLRQAIRSRDDLVAILSHDLRNPLTAISLGLTRLRRVVSRDDQTERILDSLARSCERMTRLLGDLLAIAKIEGGQLQVAPADVNLRELVHEATEALRPVLEERSQRLSIDADGEPSAFCDRERILQVLENLLGNASKFTPEGGEVRVCVRAGSNEVEVSVVDTGPGIERDSLPHVFDRFWQASRRGRAGAGLGLAIAKGIVDAHGGRIGVDSRPGAGARFWFTLPTRSTKPV